MNERVNYTGLDGGEGEFSGELVGVGGVEVRGAGDKCYCTGSEERGCPSARRRLRGRRGHSLDSL